MFDGGDLYAVALEGRRQPRIGDVLRTGRHLHGRLEIDAPKGDAGVRRRRPQRQIDLLSRVQANSRGPNDVLQRSLSDHGLRNVLIVEDKLPPCGSESYTMLGAVCTEIQPR